MSDFLKTSVKHWLEFHKSFGDNGTGYFRVDKLRKNFGILPVFTLHHSDASKFVLGSFDKKTKVYKAYNLENMCIEIEIPANIYVYVED